MSNQSLSHIKRLAVVGSRGPWSPGAADEARAKIRRCVEQMPPGGVVITGGADGVDAWAEKIARAAGVEVLVCLPENPRWEPDGYKARNTRIVEECEGLLCLTSSASTSYGSGWTADHAAAQGRPVNRQVI